MTMKPASEKLISQILWDYNIPTEDAIAVLKGEKKQAGHYTREKLFIKILESYSWFTVLQILRPEEIKLLLTNSLISKLRSPALQKKYEFVQKRLQQVIPSAG